MDDIGHAHRTSAPPEPPQRAAVRIAAFAALVVVVRLDGDWGTTLPVELLYLPALAALGWFGPASLAFLVALLAAAAPALLESVGWPGARPLALAEAAFRLFGFTAVAYAATRARARWCGLLDLSHEDSLTGLLHHGAFTDAVRRELARQRRDGGDVSVLCLDVDGFKRLNDTHGHAFGDRVLVGVAERLRAHVRASDVVSRTGGDEFAVLLRGDAVAAAVVREHLRAVLAGWTAAERLPIGFSFGGATSEAARPVTADVLLDRADREMYREKERHHVETGVHARGRWPAPRRPGGDSRVSRAR